VEGTPVQVARVAAQGSDDAHAESDNNVRVQQRILELEEEKRHREEERKHEKKMKRLQKELERTNPGVNAP
jgi:membrane protein involved in colicin uptake